MTTRGNSVRVLKEANKYMVLQCILSHGPLSTDQVIRLTGLSYPTVLNLLHDLMEQDLIIKDGYVEGSVGRNAALLNLNDHGHYALGIDFEFPSVRLALSNMRGQAVARRNLVYPEDILAADLIVGFQDQLSAFISDSGIPLDQIEGAGMGLSGVIDSARGISLNIERIRNWDHVPIRQILEDQLGIPVFIRNDVHLLGLAEKRLYLPESISDFLYVAVRTGIGGIAYRHGKAMHGTKGNAGFIGHTTMSAHGPRCRCGNRGCLETYSGQTAIMNAYFSVSRERLPFPEIVERARQQEALAARVLEDAGFYFGVALANLIKVFEIPRVIVGGSSALENSSFMEAAARSMMEYSTPGLSLDISLTTGNLKEEEYALGGCFLVYDHLFSKPHLSLSPAGVG